MKRVRDKFFALSKHTDEKCKDCMLEHFCSGCYGMNYFNNGKLGNYDKDFCEMNIHMAQKVIVNLTKCYQKIKVGE